MKNKQGVFITGTDTEVGKTYYTCRLLQALKKQGLRTAAMKPVASGAQCIEGQLRNEDALQLIDAANTKFSYRTCNPYCFAPAIAPHLAAAQAEQRIELGVIEDYFIQLQQQADMTVVEGVGGWLVPLNESDTVADLAIRLKLPVILVVGLRLGCINHALLTARAISDSGLVLVGWIANGVEAGFPMQKENIDSIAKRLAAPCLDVLPYQANHANNSPVEQDININWL